MTIKKRVSFLYPPEKVKSKVGKLSSSCAKQQKTSIILAIFRSKHHHTPLQTISFQYNASLWRDQRIWIRPWTVSGLRQIGPTPVFAAEYQDWSLHPSKRWRPHAAKNIGVGGVPPFVRSGTFLGVYQSRGEYELERLLWPIHPTSLHKLYSLSMAQLYVLNTSCVRRTTRHVCPMHSPNRMYLSWTPNESGLAGLARAHRYQWIHSNYQ